jgi:primosomal protein N' (replication factor Y)
MPLLWLSKKLPVHCPSCKHNEFFKKGVGTQQMVSILEKLLPNARIARADLDITSKKKIWEKTVHDFYHKTIDILVGTQSITKGFHFPHVTLVGIIWADLNLNFPHYAATEYTLQQLIQVAGRAGRQSEQSTVIVQAMQDNPLFSYLNEIDYLKFYQQEIHHRQIMEYPPYVRLVEIELQNNNEHVVDNESQQLARMLIMYQQIHQLDASILGPAHPVVHTIKKKHRRTIYLKAASIAVLHDLFNTIQHAQYKSIISWNPNPTH